MAGVRYHVLGKTLSKTELMAFGLEVSDSEGIFLGIAASKALVCHIEEWVMVLLLYYVADLPPLRFCGVDAGRVVCARVQQNDTAFGCILQIFYHAIKV